MKSKATASVEQVTDRFQQAVAEADRVSQKVSALFLLADYLVEKKAWAQTFAVYEQISTLGGPETQEEALYGTARAHLALGDRSKAKGLCQDLLLANPDTSMLESAEFLAGNSTTSLDAQLFQFLKEAQGRLSTREPGSPEWPVFLPRTPVPPKRPSPAPADGPKVVPMAASQLYSEAGSLESAPGSSRHELQKAPPTVRARQPRSKAAPSSAPRRPAQGPALEVQARRTAPPHPPVAESPNPPLRDRRQMPSPASVSETSTALIDPAPARITATEGGKTAPTPADIFAILARTDNDALARLVKSSPDLLADRDENGATPLHIAALKGNLEAVELFLANGGSLKKTDRNGWTPLHYAVSVRRARVAVLILASGADPNAIDDQGNTSLHFAVANKHLSLVEKLLQFGANPHIANRKGDFPADWAVRGEFRDRCRDLFETSAPSSEAMAESLRTTAKGIPHPSEVRRFEAMVDLVRTDNLGEFQARIRQDPTLLSVHNFQGATVFHAAAFLGKTGFIKVLLDLDADLWENDNDGWTPLHYALAGNRIEAVSMLLNRGADFFSKDKRGLSPATMAALKSSPGINSLQPDWK